METVEILRGAKDVLRERGWYQGDYFDVEAWRDGTPIDECAVCLLGAINVALGKRPTMFDNEGQPAADALTAVLRERRATRVKVQLWNDLKKTCIEDVFALLDDAIERAAAGESA